MIRELRLRHRRLIPILAILSIAVFMAALSARKPIPESSPVPFAQPDFSILANAETHELKFTELESTLKATLHQTDSRRVLEINIIAPVKLADPLVYWTPSDMNKAQLLGPLPSSGKKTYALKNPDGSVIIYSLAQQEIIDQVSVTTGASQ